MSERTDKSTSPPSTEAGRKATRPLTGLGQLQAEAILLSIVFCSPLALMFFLPVCFRVRVFSCPRSRVFDFGGSRRFAIAKKPTKESRVPGVRLFQHVTD